MAFLGRALPVYLTPPQSGSGRGSRFTMSEIEQSFERTGALATLSTAPPRGVSKRMRGAMLWFNPLKRHGFVRTEDGERLLVEAGGFAPGHELGDRCAGTVVEFERHAAEAEGGYVARAIMVVDDASGRRARSHRGAFRASPRR
jgi:hypothetical protein